MIFFALNLSSDLTLKKKLEELEDIQWIEPEKVEGFVALGSFILIPSVLKNNANEDSILSLNTELAESLKEDIPFIE